MPMPLQTHHKRTSGVRSIRVDGIGLCESVQLVPWHTGGQRDRGDACKHKRRRKSESTIHCTGELLTVFKRGIKRHRRREVCMREMPSYGTRCKRRTSKRILWAGRTERVRSLGMSVGGLLIQVQQLAGSTHSSHSTVVPLIRTKGRPTPVCQSWGDCEQKGAGSGDQHRRDECGPGLCE